MTIIRDGAGAGNQARVNSEKQLFVRAFQIPRLSAKSDSGDAYITYGKHQLVAGSTNEALFLFQNTATSVHVHIEQIMFSTNSTAMKIELFVNMARTSGGTLRVPNNSNRTSGKTSQVLMYDNDPDDLVLTGNTAATEILDLRLAAAGTSSLVVPFDGGIILGPQDTLGAVVEGATIGDKVRASIYFYEENAEDI